MVTTDWEKVIEQKIAEAKERGSKKRGWIKLSKSWLTSSINYRMELSEQAVFSKLMLLADDCGPVPGLISDNDFRAMPHDYLAHLACCPVEIFETILQKGFDDDSIFENGHGIFMTHFDYYQFTEYDRQKPYREKKREAERLYKKCSECGYTLEDSKTTAKMELCPVCGRKGKEVKLIGVNK